MAAEFDGRFEWASVLEEIIPTLTRNGWMEPFRFKKVSAKQMSAIRLRAKTCKFPLNGDRWRIVRFDALNQAGRPVIQLT